VAGSGVALYGQIREVPNGLTAGQVRDMLGRSGGPVTLTRLPAVVNVVVYQGDDFALSVHVHEPDGTDADLTSAVFAAEIRDAPRADGGLVLGSWDLDDDGPVIRARLSAATCEGLPRTSVYDLRMALGGWRTTLIAGTISTVASVSE
jgi:hypothetical protein